MKCDHVAFGTAGRPQAIKLPGFQADCKSILIIRLVPAVRTPGELQLVTTLTCTNALVRSKTSCIRRIKLINHPIHPHQASCSLLQ
jgi:hypothetical protein